MKINLTHIALAGIGVGILAKFINVSHWAKINWNMVSYDPMIPVLGLFAALVYLYVLHKKRITFWYLWIFGLTALVYDLFLLYGVMETYGKDFWMNLI